jgi:predicted ester cyclase
VEDQLAEGDKVATRWRAVGTHQGELLGVPASGLKALFSDSKAFYDSRLDSSRIHRHLH